MTSIATKERTVAGWVFTATADGLELAGWWMFDRICGLLPELEGKISVFLKEQITPF